MSAAPIDVTPRRRLVNTPARAMLYYAFDVARMPLPPRMFMRAAIRGDIAASHQHHVARNTTLSL